MSEENAALESEFQKVYLKEIGVHTPWAVAAERGVKAVSHPVSEPAREQIIQEAASVAVLPSSEPLKTSGTTTNTSPAMKPLSLDALAAEAASCTRCALAEHRTQVVFGVGNPDADLVLIGEAPGPDEDAKGEPFMESSGVLLDRMLAAIGMDRKQVYIMNTVKCHPLNNRDPKPEEVQACGHWFDAQLKAVKPKMICLLGRVAAQTVLQTDASLSSMRGRWHDYHGIPTWVIYHPAYLLRSPHQKHRAWTDLCRLNQRYQAIQDA